GFVNQPLGSSQSGFFTVQFDASPSISPSNATVGLCQGAQTGYPGIACIVRFNTTGTIDARNGGAYAAATSVPFSAGSTYHFRLAVNLPAHTYLIYVSPADGAKTTLGTD